MSSLKDRRRAPHAPTPDTHPGLAYRKEGRRWRGKRAAAPNAHPLVRRLIEEANAQMTTLLEIETRAGLRRSTISNWGRRNHPRVDTLDAALNVLGLKLAVVPEGWKL